MKKLFLIISLLFSAPISIASAAAPANDNFANRQTIGLGAVTAITTEATVEAGEPRPGSYRTVWYSFTPTTDSIITIDTTGTNFYSSFVRVFMGSSINQLTVVTGEAGGSPSSPYSFTFKAKANTTFQICAGSTNSYNSSDYYGSLKLTLLSNTFTHTGPLYGPAVPTNTTPANDSFASRSLITGNNLTVIAYTTSASVEAGEPRPDSYRTVWYSYTATTDSIITIDTTGTDFYSSFVRVFMGNSINQLAVVTGEAGGSPSSPYSFTFKAKANTTFQICTGSTNSYDSSDYYGTIQLTLTTTPFAHVGTLYGPGVPTAPTPLNDSFYTPQVLSGNSLTVVGSNWSATIEPGESGISRTLWYSWTPASNKYVVVDFPTELNFSRGTFGVFTGDSPQTVVQVPQIPGGPTTSYAFNAIGGKTYKMLVASTSSDYGLFQLSLTATNPPANDAPVAKITSPKGGRTVSTNGFYMTAYVNDSNGISAFQIKVNGKLVHNKSFPYTGSLFSGKVKKGKVTLQIRAKDTLGLWGSYRTVKVTAK